MNNEENFKTTPTPKVLAGSFTFAAILAILIIAICMKAHNNNKEKISDLQDQIDDLTEQINHETRDSLAKCALWPIRVEYNIQMYKNATSDPTININTTTQNLIEYYQKLCTAYEEREKIRQIGEYFTKKYQPKMDSLKFEQRKLQEKKL